jgi:uncharacterized protein (UPF0179 family)
MSSLLMRDCEVIEEEVKIIEVEEEKEQIIIEKSLISEKVKGTEESDSNIPVICSPLREVEMKWQEDHETIIIEEESLHSPGISEISVLQQKNDDEPKPVGENK